MKGKEILTDSTIQEQEEISKYFVVQRQGLDKLISAAKPGNTYGFK